jgi:hypothetical protein
MIHETLLCESFTASKNMQARPLFRAATARQVRRGFTALLLESR